MTKYIVPLLPALLAFGPVFIVIGLQPDGLRWFAYVGALMTSLGLLVMFALIGRNAQVLNQVCGRVMGQQKDTEQDKS
ncbi:MAG: hypothetical protein ACYTG5_14175 [Planctomycetota bacterium]|jgi:hypothetical protein